MVSFKITLNKSNMKMDFGSSHCIWLMYKSYPAIVVSNLVQLSYNYILLCEHSVHIDIMSKVLGYMTQFYYEYLAQVVIYYNKTS